MSIRAVFGLSILLSFVAFGLVTRLFIWSRLRVMARDDALLPLVVPHTFRFIGLSFLVPGVVSPALRILHSDRIRASGTHHPWPDLLGACSTRCITLRLER
jgi:hypothetical protein